MKAEELVGLMAEYFRGKRVDRPRNRKLFVSDLGSEGCRLAFYRRLRNFPQVPKKPGELLMFMQGENLEEQVADALANVLAENSDWELVDRQTSNEVEGITGKLDILMRNSKTGELLVLEVKSKRGNAFKWLDEPKRPNVVQTRAYMMGTDADKGLLVYVDREGQNFMKIFPVERDDEDVKKEIAIAKEIATVDAEPGVIKPYLKRNTNKGDDSLELKLPWQIEWCGDAECPCRKKAGKIPSGVVAKVKDDGDVYAVKGKEEFLAKVREIIG